MNEQLIHKNKKKEIKFIKYHLSIYQISKKKFNKFSKNYFM